MKKGILFIIFITLFTLTGCSKKDSPETAAKEFISSFMTGDVESFNKYATDSTKGIFVLAMSMKCNQDKLQNNMAECLKEVGSNLKSVEVKNVKQINENEAVVTLKETYANGKISHENIPVIKTKDGWKVNIKK
ncbi:putative lipoprotein [Nautilia profundicola AmH]|uniref:Lipoprotein n=1 Tax=Nautilia profundicola (strain ATCC BAA-1463 / DSM 18972 / AmH) TaxID=598659 RepID=B9L7K8_NAUPA|nr:DUF4878 domain-containing protein [Nautilia profundicola]ACM92516.1 putative lipoprotein [Nautilia profundicola AmH]